MKKSDKILVGALLALALALELEQWLQGVLFVIVPTVAACIMVLISILVAKVRHGWIPVIPLVVSAFILFQALKSPDELDHLTHLFTLPFFAAVIGLVTMGGTLLASINALMQNNRVKK